MALSNAEGHLVLATGNKSELSVGYSTIYGDAVGGFAPIKDVAEDAGLASWRGGATTWPYAAGETPPIPPNSIDKPPSAELRPGQLDTDSLPDYELLDDVLDDYVEQRPQRRRASSRPASIPRWSSGCCGWSTAPSTSGASTRPAPRSR